MMYLGIFLLVAAIGALVWGFLQQKKMKSILAAPFKKTGEIASNPQAGDAKGTVSCEGAIQASQPLTAPCSGQPCLYYEIEIKQMWEKHVKTENGVKKQTGKNTAHSEKRGSIFQVNDGSGAINVNAMEGIDGQLEKVFDERSGRGYGQVVFGQYQASVSPIADREKHETGTQCIEKIVPAQGNIFVMGKLEGGQISKRDGMLGKLMLSTKGRDALIGATKRNMMIGFIAGAVMLPTGGGMAAFGEAPAAAEDTCANMTDDIVKPCLGRQYNDADVPVTWTVTADATYKFKAVGTGTDQNMRMWPRVQVQDATGTNVFEMSASGGAPVEGTGEIKAGTYTILVGDTHYGWADDLQGGAGFSLDMDKVQ
jgi:hypothetical protein